jgi:hypothetical protein
MERDPTLNRAIPDEELDALVRPTEDATTAFINGDMERYLELTPHASGFERQHAQVGGGFAFLVIGGPDSAGGAPGCLG